MNWRRPYPVFVGVLALTTACHGDCSTLRNVHSSGRFGDTLVAVSGSGTEPGTVKVYIQENQAGGSTWRYGDMLANATGTAIDTVSLYRMTLVSDPNRAPVFSATKPGYINVDSITFEALFVHLATEDVLFEIVDKNGKVLKALLNLDGRSGPVEVCEPYT